MRIVASLVSYPPHRFIGSELMTHRMLSELANRGHHVQVVTMDPTEPYVRDGVRVQAGAVPHGDVLIYHPDFPKHAEAWSGPKVAICHNSRMGVQLGLYNTRPNLVVVNSDAMSKELPHPRKVVVHPPVEVPDRFTAGDAVGIINMEASSKIGPFWEVARAMPDRHFVGVKGGYGKQAIPPGRPRKNVTVLEQLPHDRMDEVWSRIGILMVPSATESWSMVASEALAHGIPVIAHPLPGLVENLGRVGLWAHRDRPDEWVDRIRSLDSCWPELSALSRERALEQAEAWRREVDAWCVEVEKL